MSNLAMLPKEFQQAQAAIDLPEIQQVLQTLAKYNLGICMPHMHNANGDFEILPSNMVQLEDDLQVSFVKDSEINQIKSIPVAWQWYDDGIKAMARCVQHCVLTSNQSGGEGHKRMHSK